MGYIIVSIKLSTGKTKKNRIFLSFFDSGFETSNKPSQTDKMEGFVV